MPPSDSERCDCDACREKEEEPCACDGCRRERCGCETCRAERRRVRRRRRQRIARIASQTVGSSCELMWVFDDRKRPVQRVIPAPAGCLRSYRRRLCRRRTGEDEKKRVSFDKVRVRYYHVDGKRRRTKEDYCYDISVPTAVWSARAKPAVCQCRRRIASRDSRRARMRSYRHRRTGVDEKNA